MLAESVDVKVRPLASPSLEKASLLGAARVYVSRDTLLSLTGSLKPGRHCIIRRLETATKEDGPQPELQREASLYILPEKNLSPNVVMMTRVFQDITGFKVGDQTRITLGSTAMPETTEVVMQDVTEDSDKKLALEEIEKKCAYAPEWRFPITLAFEKAQQVFPGMVVETKQGQYQRDFKVISVNSQTNNLANFAPSTTVINIVDDSTANAEVEAQSAGDLVLRGVPGMAVQVKKINRFFEGFTRELMWAKERDSCAFVIHGGHGTGKSFILNRIAETRWGKVHWIKPSDKLSTMRETFKLAQSQQPSMILIDNLQDLISKDRSNVDSVIELLRDELASLSASASLNNALPRVLIVATCSDFFTDIPNSLRGRGGFADHTPLPIPRTQERLEILEFENLHIEPAEKQSILSDLAQKTHAYSPRDLGMICHEANLIASYRILDAGIGASPEERYIKRSDVEEAKRMVKPTVMRDINLNPPTIHWQDVGGQDVLKKVLNRMVKYTKNPERSLRPPPKGLLLYGPPGCSKTLSAQAAATESGFNFFAVKGAELLNMYVGETERAIRTLFERASNAAPSIIFFDEIDSIGGQRSGSGSASRSTGSVNMLTTLLTEMDGFEALSGVLILAATNRPESMDPALMRPGRFDQILYVGPPDGPTREAIFNVHLRGLPLASDVDIPELSRLSEGYSGAEIKAVCTETCLIVQESFEDGEIEKLELSMSDLTTVLKRTPRNITQQMIDGYEKWSKQFKKV
ncbi:unnamed protein product [Fusarium equiseti]|uniref:AAA+ ATPase domain-containing protein n=1 Tax=Fusarium equiseti TaxID=61235 RepID=A0A8J2NDU5_FUSEQ|nr:unnamed protein product [Fusarium equiseti]